VEVMDVERQGVPVRAILQGNERVCSALLNVNYGKIKKKKWVRRFGKLTEDS
jgi:hypothetical protein